MASQETVAKISLAVSAAGLLALWVLAGLFEAKEVSIAEIDENLVECRVRVSAQVASSYRNQETLFLELYDGTGKIKAVVFKAEGERFAGIGKNSFAEFSGKVKLYKGELEIIVEAVEPWH
jgi:aspartyl/asparaginyl-tRNA synthetase